VSKAPTGNVTIVFTDIQGSTALWERFEDGFSTALQLHHETVRTQLKAHGGYEVKTEGDAFMVAFDRAEAALAFCIQTQVALHHAPWPTTLLEDCSPIAAALSTVDGAFRGVRVRMGVHSGRPTAAPDPQTGRTDYVGRMVNKAARIARAGHGGQILVSARAWDRAKKGLDHTTIEVVDLGEHALRDIAGREHIREIRARDLPGRSFPPIKTLRIRRSNLHPAEDRFLGRADELSAMDEHLRAGTRLLCLVGPTGVGKRRLATEFGFRHLEAMDGGVWAADLSECQSLAEICTAVAAALDMALTQPDPVAQIGNALLGRGPVMLLLVDLPTQSEQVSDAVLAWLKRAPDARILTTATLPLPHPEAQILPLDPLPARAARALLRARSAGVKVDTKTWSQAAQGIPLCIELLGALLSAGVTPAMEPAQQALPPTAAALRQAIAASIAGLDGAVAEKLVLLSVFCGGFSRTAACAVGAETALEVLLRRRLVQAVGPDRWRIPTAIGEWIAEHYAHDLGPGGAAPRAHGVWAKDLAQAANAAGDTAALVLERDNLLVASIRATDRDDAETASETSIGLISALHWLGPPSAALTVASRALALDGLTPRARTHLLRLRALTHHFTGALELAREDLIAAGQLAQTIDDPTVAAQVYLEQGRHHDDEGAVELALTAFQSSLDAFHAAEDPAGEGRAIAAMGNMAAKRGALSSAERLYVAALAQHRRGSDPQAEGAVLSNLAILTTIADRPAEARELFRDALAIHRSQGDRRGEAVVLGNLGDLYLQTEEWDIARTHLDSALRTAREIGDRHIEGCYLGSLGEVSARAGRLPQARSQMARAERLLREVGDTYELIKLICRRGHVELLGQYPARAEQCLGTAEALLAALSLGPETMPHRAIEELRKTLAAGEISDGEA
jgi:class 3 adenylate cyclase/tetratricopeptide (TPR) repeat protein